MATAIYLSIYLSIYLCAVFFHTIGSRFRGSGSAASLPIGKWRSTAQLRPLSLAGWHRLLGKKGVWYSEASAEVHLIVPLIRGVVPNMMVVFSAFLAIAVWHHCPVD